MKPFIRIFFHLFHFILIIKLQSFYPLLNVLNLFLQRFKFSLIFLFFFRFYQLIFGDDKFLFFIFKKLFKICKNEFQLLQQLCNMICWFIFLWILEKIVENARKLSALGFIWNFRNFRNFQFIWILLNLLNIWTLGILCLNRLRNRGTTVRWLPELEWLLLWFPWN